MDQTVWYKMQSALKIQPICFLFCLFFFARQFCIVEFHAVASVSCTNNNCNKVHDFVCPLFFCVLLNAWQNVLCSVQSKSRQLLFATVYTHGVCILRAKIQKVIDILNIRTDWAFICAHAHSTSQHCTAKYTNIVDRQLRRTLLSHYALANSKKEKNKKSTAQRLHTSLCGFIALQYIHPKCICWTFRCTKCAHCLQFIV